MNDKHIVFNPYLIAFIMTVNRAFIVGPDGPIVFFFVLSLTVVSSDYKTSAKVQYS